MHIILFIGFLFIIYFIIAIIHCEILNSVLRIFRKSFSLAENNDFPFNGVQHLQ